nr:PD-(D/E)XK nuclease family protein [Lachnospiraceae bacterium]
LGQLIEKSSTRGILKQKLTDIRLLYNEFLKYINDKYITTEEILQKVRAEVPRSKKLKKTVIVLDGYTGFTPVQRGLIEELLVNCADVYVTLLWDTSYHADRNINGSSPDEQDLFYLSRKTIAALEKMCKDRGVARKDDVILSGEVPARFMYDSEGNRLPENKRRKDLIHLERNLFRTREAVYIHDEEEAPAGSIHVFTGTDPYEEAIEAAVRIERLIREEGYHYKDIAVVTGDLETYMNTCVRAFTRYDIPCFVDKKAPVMLNPLIEYIRALFDIMTDDYSYEAMLRYLRTTVSGYPVSDIDDLENYILRYGIKGRAAWDGKFVLRPQNMEEADLERLNYLRESIVTDIGEFGDALLQGADDTMTFDVRTVSTALYRFLSTRKLQEKMEAMKASFEENGDKVRAMEYGRIYEEVCDLLNKTVILMPGEKMTLREYADILDAGYAEIRTGVLPGTDDYIQIGDITRTRLRDIKALFFMGVNDGVIPAQGGSGGIISDMDREFLASFSDTDNTGEIELAPTARMKAYEQRLYLYMLTSKPGEHLYISYSRLSPDGASMNPSYFVKTITRMFPGIKTELPDESPDNRAYGYRSAHHCLAEGAQDALRGVKDDKAFEGYLNLLGTCMIDEGSAGQVDAFMKGALDSGPVRGNDKISRAVAKALYGTDLSCSITRLETYARCAYAHFMKYGLSLKERELFSFEANDMGSVFHDALKEYAGILREREMDWISVEEEEAEAIIEEAIERSIAAGDYSAVYGSFRTRYSVNRMKRIVKRTVNVLTDHLKKGSFTPGETELDFTTGDEIRLIGRVDRMDVYTGNGNTYIKIIDYKSGSRKFDLAAVYVGLDLQLVVYLNAGMELVSKRYEGSKVIPAGIFYYHIDDPVIEDNNAGSGDEDTAAINKKIMDSFRMTGLVNSDETVYRLMDNDFVSKSGVIPVALKKDGGFAVGSSVASEEEFGVIRTYTNCKIKDLGKEILDGNIKAEPHRMRSPGTVPCEYCEYRDACTYKGDGTDVTPKDDDIIELMRKRTENEE